MSLQSPPSPLLSDQEKMLFDFRRPQTWQGWQIVNDGVMGGRSESLFQQAEANFARFSGEVSLANQGGFASLRSPALGGATVGYLGLSLCLRGDGQLYQCRLRSNEAAQGEAYRYPFQSKAGEWQIIRFPFARTEAVFRGRRREDAPLLQGAMIAQVGFLIAGGQAGPFNLDLAWIGLWSDEII